MRRPCLVLLSLLMGTATVFTAHAVDGDSLTVALENDVRSLDPRFTSDANSQYLENLVHCSLMTFDANGVPAPELAAEMPKWLNATTLEIKLNPAAKFASGAQVTAEDVKATYDSLLSTSGKTLPKTGAFAFVESIQATKPDTVIFTLKSPDAPLISNLVIGILPKSQVTSTQITDLSAFNGCGPFKVVASAVNEIQLAPNTNYGLGPVAKLFRLIVRIVKDENTRYFKLRKGELDIVQNALNRDVLKYLPTRYPNLQIVRRSGQKTSYLGFNMRDKLTGNPAIRQAIAMAIDRQVLITYGLGGLAIPANTMLPPTDPYYNAALKPQQLDLTAAQKLLDDAGFKVGPDGKTRFSLSFKTTTDMTRITIAKAIATQLGKIGIQVKVESMEWGRFKADVEHGRVQMWTLQWIGFKDPDIYRFAFGTDSFPPNGGNRGFYSNPKLDALLKAGRETPDVTKRKAIYAEVQAIIDADHPYVFLWHEENFAVLKKSVKDFELYSDGRLTSLRQTSKQ